MQYALLLLVAPTMYVLPAESTSTALPPYSAPQPGMYVPASSAEPKLFRRYTTASGVSVEVVLYAGRTVGKLVEEA